MTALDTTGAGPAALHGVLSFGSDSAVSPVCPVCPHHQPPAPSSLKLSTQRPEATHRVLLRSHLCLCASPPAVKQLVKRLVPSLPWVLCLMPFLS